MIIHEVNRPPDVQCRYCHYNEKLILLGGSFLIPQIKPSSDKCSNLRLIVSLDGCISETIWELDPFDFRWSISFPVAVS